MHSYLAWYESDIFLYEFDPSWLSRLRPERTPNLIYGRGLGVIQLPMGNWRSSPGKSQSPMISEWLEKLTIRWSAAIYVPFRLIRDPSERSDRMMNEGVVWRRPRPVFVWELRIKCSLKICLYDYVTKNIDSSSTNKVRRYSESKKEWFHYHHIRDTYHWNIRLNKAEQNAT